MAQVKTETNSLPLLLPLLSEPSKIEEENDYYQPTAEEIAQDWDILRQYEAEYGPLESASANPTVKLIEPDQITLVLGVPARSIARKSKES